MAVDVEEVSISRTLADKLDENLLPKFHTMRITSSSWEFRFRVSRWGLKPEEPYQTSGQFETIFQSEFVVLTSWSPH